MQEVTMLDTKLQDTETELKQKLQSLQTFCSTLTGTNLIEALNNYFAERLELLKQKLTEQESATKQKEDDLLNLRAEKENDMKAKEEQIRNLVSQQAIELNKKETDLLSEKEKYSTL